MQASATITGDKKIDRKFKRLSTSGQRKISRAMLSKMMTEISRGIRNAIPPKYPTIKKTIGRRNKKNRKTHEHEAKVGLGVGKQGKSKKQRDPRKPGVGISKRNIHWFILGTMERHTKSGRSTGKMPKAPDWVKQGYAASQGIALKKAHEVGRKKVLEEVKKL